MPSIISEQLLVLTLERHQVPLMIVNIAVHTN